MRSYLSTLTRVYIHLHTRVHVCTHTQTHIPVHTCAHTFEYTKPLLEPKISLVLQRENVFKGFLEIEGDSFSRSGPLTSKVLPWTRGRPGTVSRPVPKVLGTRDDVPGNVGYDELVVLFLPTRGL